MAARSPKSTPTPPEFTLLPAAVPPTVLPEPAAAAPRAGHVWYRTDADGETVRLALYLPTFLRKNERYRAFGRGKFARIILSKPARIFEATVAHVLRVINAPPITSGVWSLTVHTLWDKQRHVGPDVPAGDSDASLSAIKDAIQNAGGIDDDVRIITDQTFNWYRKGERGLYAVLQRLDMSEVPTNLPVDMLSAMQASTAPAFTPGPAITRRSKAKRDDEDEDASPAPKATRPKRAKRAPPSRTLKVPHPRARGVVKRAPAP